MFNIFYDCITNIIFLALHILNPNAFPKILSKEEESKLIDLLEKNDKNAKNKLIEHNLRLVAHITKKFYNSNEDNEDLISIGTIGLIKGIKTFKKFKGIKLSSYISRCIENEILMYFRSVKKTCLDVSLNEPIESSKDGNSITLLDTLTDNNVIFDEISTKINSQNINKYLKSNFKERERIIIILRYGLDGNKSFTQQEVADRLKISRSYVSRIEKKAILMLRSMIA